MIDAQEFLRNLALVLCVAAFAAVVFQRLRMPVIFGYLVAGMIVGPHMPIPLVANETMIHSLSELGVTLLMYSLGLDFSLRRFLKIGATVGVASVVAAALMFILGYAVAGALGWTPVEQAFTGAMVSITSTTVLAHTLMGKEMPRRMRDMVYGISIIDDIVGFVFIAALSAIAAGGGVSLKVISTTGASLLSFLVILTVLGMLVLPRLMRLIVSLGSAETTLIAGVGIAFLSALLAMYFGFSVALGSFTAGLLVAESGHGRRVEKLIEPVRDMFVAIFFVSVGMLIDPSVLIEHWGAVVALTLLILLGKTFSISVGVFLNGFGLPMALRAGLSMAHIGEFSFIIAGVGVATGAARGFLYPVVIAASALTILVAPYMANIAPRVSQQLDRNLPRKLQTFISLYGSWIEEMKTRRTDSEGTSEVRRLLRRLFVDILVIVVLIVAVGVQMDSLTALLRQWSEGAEGIGVFIVITAVAITAIPFVIGTVRISRALATIMAFGALPAGPEAVDRAMAPRTALIVTLQSAILIGVSLPVVAVLQVFVPRLSALWVLLVIATLLGISIWRASGTLHSHALAGAEAIVLALTQNNRASGSEELLSQTMENVSVLLPGLGHPGAVRLESGNPTIGRTLRELDIRGLTGATVLAITRVKEGARQAVIPTGKEKLEVDDVVALAGTEESVQAARQILLTGVAPVQENDEEENDES